MSCQAKVLGWPWLVLYDLLDGLKGQFQRNRQLAGVGAHI